MVTNSVLVMLPPCAHTLAFRKQCHHPFLAANLAVERRSALHGVDRRCELASLQPVEDLQFGIRRQLGVPIHQAGPKRRILTLGFPTQHPPLVLRALTQRSQYTRREALSPARMPADENRSIKQEFH